MAVVTVTSSEVPSPAQPALCPKQQRLLLSLGSHLPVSAQLWVLLSLGVAGAQGTEFDLSLSRLTIVSYLWL